MCYVDKYIPDIETLCKKYNVSELYVFGSVLTPLFNDESDVDFLVSFNKDKISDYFENFFDFKYAVEDILHRPVDLVESSAIRNKYFIDEVNSTKRMIYAY
ncbi:MAG: nucleotidyltransferase domain-containing protein [Bacteroidales bacterium]|nr:nucleotidyltransferase domain-containing protein [Bacteroidales bacterium]